MSLVRASCQTGGLVLLYSVSVLIYVVFDVAPRQDINRQTWGCHSPSRTPPLPPALHPSVRPTCHSPHERYRPRSLASVPTRRSGRAPLPNLPPPLPCRAHRKSPCSGSL